MIRIYFSSSVLWRVESKKKKNERQKSKHHKKDRHKKIYGQIIINTC